MHGEGTGAGAQRARDRLALVGVAAKVCDKYTRQQRRRDDRPWKGPLTHEQREAVRKHVGGGF